MDLLQLLFLELLVMAFEFRYLVYRIIIDLVVQIQRHFDSLLGQELGYELIYFSEGKLKYLLALKWREQVVACWIIIQFLSVHYCDLD